MLFIPMFFLLLTSSAIGSADWPARSQATRAALHLTESDGICAIDHTSVTALSFFSLLGAGLLTGLSHCIGMCGPLVSAFTLKHRSARQDVLTPLVGMQMGRLTTYALMGGCRWRHGVGFGWRTPGMAGAFCGSPGAHGHDCGAGIVGGIPAVAWGC